MNFQDPFGRPQSGAPFSGQPFGGGAPQRRRGLLAPLLVGFVIFDLFVLLVVGGLFAVGAIGGSDVDDDYVVIPPTAADVARVEAQERKDGVQPHDAAAHATGSGTTVVTRESGTSAIVTPKPAQPAKPAGPAPQGLNATSLLRAENLRPALASAKQLAGGGRITNLRLDAARLNVQVATPSGDLVIMTAQAGQPAQVVTRVEGGASTRDGVRFSDINPAAPERLVRAAGAAGTGSKAVNYLVIQPALAPWALHTMGGARVAADASGKPE